MTTDNKTLLALADQLVEDWDTVGRMPGMAWDFRGFAVEGMMRALTSPVPTDAGVLRDALQRIVDFAGDPRTPIYTAMKLRSIARAALAVTPAAGGHPTTFKALTMLHQRIRPGVEAAPWVCNEIAGILHATIEQSCALKENALQGSNKKAYFPSEKSLHEITLPEQYPTPAARELTAEDLRKAYEPDDYAGAFPEQAYAAGSECCPECGDDSLEIEITGTCQNHECGSYEVAYVQPITAIKQSCVQGGGAEALWVDPMELLACQKHGGMLVGTMHEERESRRTQPLYTTPTPKPAAQGEADWLAIIVDVLYKSGRFQSETMIVEVAREIELALHQATPPAPHCDGCTEFDYDCLDCSDALERVRKADVGVLDAVDMDNGFIRYPWTYQNQPGNVGASVLGKACNQAASASAGDTIDRGLGLLKSLHEYGFGIVRVLKLTAGDKS